MARRRYRRHRQVAPSETIGTLVVLAVAAVIGFAVAGQASATPYVAGFVGILLASGALYATWYVYRQQTQRRALRLLTLDEVDHMSGLQFEDYVAELFRAQGYHIQMTPINDYGVDIVIAQDGVRTAVQTKCYSKPVAQEAVREAVAGMRRYHCSRSMVVTNNTFTKSARELARSNHCTLIDRAGLAQLAAKARAR